MAGNAFTFGVKPGGLTDRSQVSILLCYLIRTAAPLCRQDIENALLGEQLVNYFELAGSLADLEDQGLVTVDENGGYHITPKGISVTDELGFDLLPRSVRETAIRAVIRAVERLRLKLFRVKFARRTAGLRDEFFLAVGRAKKQPRRK